MSERRTIAVDLDDGCGGCPFFYEEDDGYILGCTMGGQPVVAEYERSRPIRFGPPDECPLRDAPILVCAEEK